MPVMWQFEGIIRLRDKMKWHNNGNGSTITTIESPKRPKTFLPQAGKKPKTNAQVCFAPS